MPIISLDESCVSPPHGVSETLMQPFSC